MKKRSHFNVITVIINLLNTQFAAVHEEKKSFKCNICDKVFSQKQDINRHIESVHEGK